jgi:hypothetical protein
MERPIPDDRRPRDAEPGAEPGVERGTEDPGQAERELPDAGTVEREGPGSASVERERVDADRAGRDSEQLPADRGESSPGGVEH